MSSCITKAVADLLHPLTTLHWEECYALPHGGLYPKCLVVNRKLYVAATFKYTTEYQHHLYVYNYDLSSWSPLSTPTEQQFGISGYSSGLVLVGGKEASTGKVTNKVWFSEDGTNWEPSLPSLPMPRSSPSVVNTGSPEYLIVAGGDGQEAVRVDVLKGGQWLTAQTLPKGGSSMLWAIHNWNLCFCLYGGHGNKQPSVLYCNIDSLLATAKLAQERSGSISGSSSVWKETRVPVHNSTPISLHEQLVVLGDAYPKTQPSYPHIAFTTKIYAYSPNTQKWVHTGDVPCSLCHPDTTVLPTGELLVVGEHNGTQTWKTLKATPTVTLYDPDGHLSMSALWRLENVGIQVVTELANKCQQLKAALCISLDKESQVEYNLSNHEECVEILIRLWTQGENPTVPPTWRSLYKVLDDLDLTETSHQIVDYLTGVKPLREICLSVIVAALLQQRSLLCNQLKDTLPHYIPTSIKNYIIYHYKTQRSI